LSPATNSIKALKAINEKAKSHWVYEFVTCKLINIISDRNAPIQYSRRPLVVILSTIRLHRSIISLQQQGAKGRRKKNSRSFPGFSRATNILFHRLSQQKVNVIMTFIKGHDDPVYPVNSCFTQIFE